MPSIEKWLQGFIDAKLVVTDSFHACVFSIIFNKPFIVLGNHERGNARFDSLLKLFNLQDNLVVNLDSYSLERILSSRIENKKIEDLRNKSIQFLKQFI